MFCMADMMIFTFHNVSINTENDMLTKNIEIDFTFHYVSINTFYDLEWSNQRKLYIPQCFY